MKKYICEKYEPRRKLIWWELEDCSMCRHWDGYVFLEQRELKGELKELAESFKRKYGTVLTKSCAGLGSGKERW
jgi:hypothetical protein